MISRRRIALTHQKLEVQNGQTSWVPKGILWCRLTPRHGHIKLIAGIEEQVVTHLVSLRFSANLEAGDRLVDTHHQLLVHSVTDPNGRTRQMECLCEQRGTTHIEKS